MKNLKAKLFFINLKKHCFYALKSRSFIFSFLVFFLFYFCQDSFKSKYPIFSDSFISQSLNYDARLTIKFAKDVTKKVKDDFFAKISFSPIVYDIFGYDIAEYNKESHIVGSDIKIVVDNILKGSNIKFIKYNIEARFYGLHNAVENTQNNIIHNDIYKEDRFLKIRQAVNFIKQNKIKFKKQGIVVVDSAPDFTHPNLENRLKHHNNKPIHWLSRSLKSNKVVDIHGTSISCLASGYRYKKWFGDSYILPLIINFGKSYLSDIAIGLKYFNKLEKDGIIKFSVVNMSFISNADLSILYDAIKSMNNKLFVVAAGNVFGEVRGILDSLDIINVYPAKWQLKNKITVGAMNSFGLVSNISLISKHFVDIIAPGENVESCIPLSNESLYEKIAGTSASTAIVSWVANMLFSMNSKLSVNEVKTALFLGAKKNKYLSNMVKEGRVLNVCNSLKYIRLAK